MGDSARGDGVHGGMVHMEGMLFGGGVHGRWCALVMVHRGRW